MEKKKRDDNKTKRKQKEKKDLWAIPNRQMAHVMRLWGPKSD